MEVRDPIHGAVELDDAEASLLTDPFVQRLRFVRQVGFSHLAFPGATHSRFAHVIGVMHIAGQAFDRAYRGWRFEHPDARARLRATVRLAALCHDIGHAPFSHCTEFAMPPVSTLNIQGYRGDPGDRRATHEDYTIAILEHGSLGRAIRASFPCDPRHVAALISHDVRVVDDFFRDGGFDHRRILSQIISSELDADRLDYLVRDAYFSGAKYGMVDVPWILSHLTTHQAHGAVWLAIDQAAVYAFEDFLVSRHHMFLQVYFHHTSVVYEEMLKRCVQDPPAGAEPWSVPADLDQFCRQDDVTLESWLRGQTGRWARRIVEHQPFRRVVERHGQGRQASVEREAERLAEEGIEAIVTESSSRLSRYALPRRTERHATLYVVEHVPGASTQRGDAAARVRPLSEASTVFERYAGAHSIGRVYVAPEERERARKVVADLER